MNYHDPNGNPIINYDRFPDLKKMTNKAHALGLTAGWYGNNCICQDNCRNETECDVQMRGDVKAFVYYNFDSWNLDGCGGENDLVKLDKYLREYAQRPIMVENCHWGRPKYDPDRSLPPSQGCPYNFYRTSNDITPNYGSVMNNLASVEKYRRANQSYPGCWACADMLEVGVTKKDGSFGLTVEETRSHFGGWAIVSSPLLLTHDVNNDTVTDRIWDIISNWEVIAINQAYFGDSGGVYFQSDELVVAASDDAVTQSMVKIPAQQYLSKPLGTGRVALLLMNGSEKVEKLTAHFRDVPGLACTKVTRCRCHVRDVWSHRDIGFLYGSYSVSVGPHDAAFLLLESNPGPEKQTSLRLS